MRDLLLALIVVHVATGRILSILREGSTNHGVAGLVAIGRLGVGATFLDARFIVSSTAIPTNHFQKTAEKKEAVPKGNESLSEIPYLSHELGGTLTNFPRGEGNGVFNLLPRRFISSAGKLQNVTRR